MEKTKKKALQEVPEDSLKKVSGGSKDLGGFDPNNGEPALIYGNQCYNDCIKRTGDAVRCKKQCVQ